MKKTILSAAFALTMIFGAQATEPTNPVKKEIKIKESNITWVGKKIGGQHSGTINLKEGMLTMDGDKLTGGTFTIDMTTITVTDLKAGKGKEKLEGHLKSGDFFDVTAFPTASFVITDAAISGNGYSALGTVTIKGVSQPFKIQLIKNGNTFTAKTSLDRTKFGITYKSKSVFANLKDAVIKDNFDLEITLKI